MQDYIFNSRKQASRRRRRLLFRLFLFALLVGIAAVLFNRFGVPLFQAPATDEQKEDRELLPLPPIEETRPAADTRKTPAATTARISPQADTTGKARATGSPAPGRDGSEHQRIERAPAVAETTTAPSPASQTESPLSWREHLIKQGDTLAAIFKELELTPALLHAIVNSSKTAAGLAHIRPGQQLKLALDEQGELQQIILQRDRVSSLRIIRTDSGYQAEEHSREVERRKAVAQGHIASSLFVDGQKAGLSDAQIMELATIFGWDIDFALELREGDQFRVIYEELYLDG
jgi:cell envelope opacity-associated protein A